MMKKYILAVLLLVPSILAHPQQRKVDDIIRNLRNSTGGDVLVAAHRADWRNAPENSLLAIQSAIDMGVDIVEIDVQRTSDGHLVILHDGTVDRTTNGKGFVKDMSLDAIKKLRLRNAQGRVTYHTVPTLEEAMLVLKGKAMVNLDKCYEYINEAYPILVKTGTVDHAIFKGYWLEAAKVKQDYGHLLNTIFYMAMVKLDDPQAGKLIDDFQTELKPVAFELGFTQDTARVFAKLGSIKRNGSRVWINSLWASQNAGHDDDTAEQGNLKDSYDWIIHAGANIIQTDRPAQLLAYLRERKLHR